MKKCPFCAEEIQDEAIKCRYCGELLKKPEKARVILNACPKCYKNYDSSWKICLKCNTPLKLIETNREELEQSERFNKIEEDGGFLSSLLSALVPGLGQLLRGQIIIAIVFFVSAIALGGVTYICGTRYVTFFGLEYLNRGLRYLNLGIGYLDFWVGYWIVAIISSIACNWPIYKCPKCRETVKKEAAVCRACNAKLQ